jgi:hypothetical protein
MIEIIEKDNGRKIYLIDVGSLPPVDALALITKYQIQYGSGTQK